MTTPTIIAATAVIVMLNVFALALARREDKNIANNKRRLEELEKKENEDDIH